MSMTGSTDPRHRNPAGQAVRIGQLEAENAQLRTALEAIIRQADVSREAFDNPYNVEVALRRTIDAARKVL